MARKRTGRARTVRCGGRAELQRARVRIAPPLPAVHHSGSWATAFFASRAGSSLRATPPRIRWTRPRRVQRDILDLHQRLLRRVAVERAVETRLADAEGGPPSPSAESSSCRPVLQSEGSRNAAASPTPLSPAAVPLATSSVARLL